MARVQIESARTAERDPARAADDLVRQLQGAEPRLVTLFASPDRDHLALNRAVRERLRPGTRLIGASTGGEIDRDGMHQHSVVLGALSGDFEVGLGLGRGLTVDAVAAGAAAVRQAAAELGTAAADLDSGRHVGLVMDDGFKYKKEEFLLGALEDNPALLLVGGGASAYDLSAPAATVHVDGEVTEDAALLALFHTAAPFAAMRSHFYHPTGEHLTITRVDESHRRALEIDGRPAAARYAGLDVCFEIYCGFHINTTLTALVFGERA